MHDLVLRRGNHHSISQTQLILCSYLWECLMFYYLFLLNSCTEPHVHNHETLNGFSKISTEQGIATVQIAYTLLHCHGSEVNINSSVRT